LTVAALALVESPAQLMNVLELARAEVSLASVKIVVLAPLEVPTRTQLRAMVVLARDAGHQVAWHEPRLGGAAVARTVRAVAGELSGVERLIVGDPFSGVIQVIISVTRASEVTIVDDGTATLEFARQWAAGEQLSRWHRIATAGQRRQIVALARSRVASSARRQLSQELGCHLRLFTCLPIELPRVEIIRNDFGWVRGQYVEPPPIKAGADLVGTSLVESGVVRADAYVEGVEALINRYGVDRYFAHRKESEDKLAAIERIGVEVTRPMLPLELVARRGPIGRRVMSFPSTVVHTLPVVLHGVGVEIIVRDIPDDWYTPGTTQRADGFLGEVTSSARSQYGLATAG
jgi:hypothetical protein